MFFNADLCLSRQINGHNGLSGVFLKKILYEMAWMLLFCGVYFLLLTQAKQKFS